MKFVDYIARLRFAKACLLLQNPNLRISEIAFEVGFQSLSQFNRVFKKLSGQSPTEYRAKNTTELSLLRCRDDVQRRQNRIHFGRRNA